EPIEKPAVRKTPRRRPPVRAAARRPVAATTSPGGIVQHLHWLLVLALIPLAFSLLRPKERDDNLEHRLARTLERYDPDVREQVEHKLDARLKQHDGDLTVDELLTALPEGKLEGAHLPRQTWMHWVYAAGAAALFLGFLLLISPNHGVNPAS